MYAYFATQAGNPLIVLPTASGKSLVIADFIRSAIEQWADTRIVVLTHVKELISQNFQEFVKHWPEGSHLSGIYSAGLNKRQINAQVLFAGIQSVSKRAYNLQRVDIVLVDEAHLIPRSSNTSYRRLLGELKQINPYLKVVGFTATPFRLDSGLLHIGDDAIFSDIAYEAGVKELIEASYLCPPITQSASAQINTEGIATRGGEFVAGQLEARADDPETVRVIADEICTNGTDRAGWIVFGCGVKHCEDLRDAIRARGYSAESIFGDTQAAERDGIIARFKRREIRALVSMGVLTTGFNAPHVDLVAVARPTKSTGLWIQIVGRGFRLCPGKANFLVLDFGGNIARHGPVDSPIVRDRRKGDGKGADDAPAKRCPECKADNHPAARVCFQCGHEFPAPSAKIATEASQLAILSGASRTEWRDVSDVFYTRWGGREGRPDTVRVTYVCGMTDQYSEWICPEHDGFARGKFVQWWQRRLPGAEPPETVDQVLQCQRDIPPPARIAVRPDGKFHRVIGVQMQ